MLLHPSLIAFIALSLIPARALYAEEMEIGLRDVLARAEKSDPSLGAAGARTVQAQHRVEIAKAYYYPRLDIDAIDSTGFPGSSGLLGIGGLMGSPFRSGPAVGAAASMNVLDFGRTSHDVEASRREVKSSEEDQKLQRTRVYQLALSSYFDCVASRTQESRYAQMSDEAAHVTKEVTRFVRTGQRSVVERYLAQTQSEEIQTARAAYHEKYEVARRNLALIIGMPGKPVTCPFLDGIAESTLTSLPQETKNPLVARAESDAAAARERVAQARSDFYPKLNIVASVGEMDQARLVDKQYYSAGVGIILPVFEGFKTKSTVDLAKARVLESDYNVNLATETLNEVDLGYEEKINSARVRLQHLEHEFTISQLAFFLAKKRYFSMQGQLLDVQEAMRNLLRVETQTIDFRVELLLNLGAKKVFDGGHV